VRPVDSSRDLPGTPSDQPIDDRSSPTDARPRVNTRSTDGLRERMTELPVGHPSSPREFDGGSLANDRADHRPSRDSPYSATDTEWADHLTDVRDHLAEAKLEGLSPDDLYSIDQDGEAWTAERREVHAAILTDLYSKSADVPCERQAIIAGGLAGAGKTTVLAEHADIDRSQFLTINPDDIKEELAERGLVPQIDGLSPMEACDLVHEESSHIAKQLAIRARNDGKNLIWDITMSSTTRTGERIDALRDDGYTVDGIFVDIPIDTSVRRAESRHREGHDAYCAGVGLGGRYVPPEIIRAQTDPEWGSQNRRTFEQLKPRFDHWKCYDNGVDGRDPTLIESSDY
jgi:predicted ABC-type ATPase